MARSQEPHGSHSHADSEPEWLHKHVHEPNPSPPSSDAAFELAIAGHRERIVTVDDLAQLPQSAIHNCYIVSTGHGTSGPFVFAGVRLVDFVASYVPAGWKWHYADVISADGFGNRVFADELATHSRDRPILLVTHLNDAPMARTQGLVRLIVPSETDDALRQVKWIGRIDIR